MLLKCYKMQLKRYIMLLTCYQMQQAAPALPTGLTGPAHRPYRPRPPAPPALPTGLTSLARRPHRRNAIQMLLKCYKMQLIRYKMLLKCNTIQLNCY